VIAKNAVMEIRRQKRLRSVLAGTGIMVTVLILAQCSTPAAEGPDKVTVEPTACPEDHDGPKLPSGDQAPLFVAEARAYYTFTEESLSSGPYLAVYPDGTAARKLEMGAVGNNDQRTDDDDQRTDDEALEDPQDPLLPMLGGWVDPCVFADFTAELEEIASADYGSMDSIMDGGYSVFLIDFDDGSEPVRVSVDQFGAEGDKGADPDLTGEQYDARKKLHGLLDELKGAIHDFQPLPDHVRLVQNTYGDDPDDEEVISWPGLSEFDECEMLTVSEAAVARDHLTEALIERWSSDGRIAEFGEWGDFIDPDNPDAETTSVSLAQLMPGMEGCDGQIDP